MMEERINEIRKNLPEMAAVIYINIILKCKSSNNCKREECESMVYYNNGAISAYERVLGMMGYEISFCMKDDGNLNLYYEIKLIKDSEVIMTDIL